jgi:DNA-binding NarL/FixJ family response regulator
MADRPEVRTILIVGSDPVMSAALSTLLGSVDYLRIIGQASGAKDAITLASRVHPDVAVVRGDSDADVKTIREIRAASPDTHVLVFATDESAVFRCLEAGADGYCLFSARTRVMLQAVESVALGAGWLDPNVVKRVFSTLAPVGVGDVAIKELNLSAREREIMILIAEGLTNQEIATRLKLSPETVKGHIRRAMEKLGARNRTALAVHAIEAMAAAQVAGKKVLVVEDDFVLRELFIRHLGMLGYSCELAADGTEAVRMAKDLRFAAIIMDIKLLKMDGLEATRQIRELERENAWARSLVIGITSGFCTRKQAMSAGMDEFIEKPIFFDRLRKILERLDTPPPDHPTSNQMARIGEQRKGQWQQFLDSLLRPLWT